MNRPVEALQMRTAVVSDCLDDIGLRSQCLPPAIRPLTPSMRFTGRAFTVSTMAVYRPPPTPYVGLLRALDALQTGDVYIAQAANPTASMWGELLTATAVARGVVAAVTDGLVRDTAQVMDMEFPTFGCGSTPRDINGRCEVVDVGVDISIGEVTIQTGDLVCGDIDGVVVVPCDVEEEVVARVLEKERGESAMRDALAAGELPSTAFARFGVL